MKQQKKKLVTGRLIDDCCLFCGIHWTFGGGHCYKGYENERGHIETVDGGLVIPHVMGCEVQICPECLGKIRKVIEI